MKKLLTYTLGILTGIAFLFPLISQALSVFQVGQGGTGTSTPSGILYGDNGSTSHLNTVTIGSGCTFSGGTLSCSGGGGSGTVSTSSSETANYIPFWTTNSATPAKLSGGVSSFTFDGTRLNATYASTTYVSFTTASTTNLFVSTLTNGDCVQAGAGGILTTIAGACGSSAGAAYPFSPGTTYGTASQSTTSPLWFEGSPYALFASSTSIFNNSTTSLATVSSTLWLPLLTGGGLAVDANGKVYEGATSTLSTISGTLALSQLANQNANTVVVNQTSGSAAPTALATSTFGNGLYGFGTGGYVLSENSGVPTWVATTTAGTGLTFNTGTPGNFSVNATQDITNLSNLVTNGMIYTSGSNGSLNVQTFPITVAQGGTFNTAPGSNDILYMNNADTQAIGAATSTLNIGGTALNVTGVVALVNGGTGLNSINGNSIIYTNTSGTAYVTTATSTLNLGENGGGTGATSIGANMILTNNGSSVIVASSTPTAANYLATSSVASQFPYASTTALTIAGNDVTPFRYFTFEYSTTTWTGTTTIPLGTFPAAMTIQSAQCYPIPIGGTVNINLYYGITPTKLTMFTASTSAGQTTAATMNFTSNNTPAAGATSTVDLGTPGGSITSISCTETMTNP